MYESCRSKNVHATPKESSASHVIIIKYLSFHQVHMSLNHAQTLLMHTSFSSIPICGNKQFVLGKSHVLTNPCNEIKPTNLLL